MSSWSSALRVVAPTLCALIAAAAAEGLPGAGGDGGDSWASPDLAMGFERFHPSLESALAAAADDGEVVFVAVGFQGDMRQQFLNEEALGALRPHVVTPFNDAGLGVTMLPARLLIAPQGYIIAHHEGWMQVSEQAQWLATAYATHRAGAWHGMGQPPDDGLTLLERLGSHHPLARMVASQAVMNDPEAALADLLKGLEHDLLAVRVACSRLLRRLLPPGAPRVDAWASASERQQQAAALRSWSAANPGFADLDLRVDIEPEALPVIDTALRDLRHPAPLRRTRAMTTLALLGPGVLPFLEVQWNPGQESSALAAEAVRWAILIPSDVERSLQVRGDLIRGNSRERQEATARLGLGGGRALPALRALLADGDTLVRERALHALAEVGGAESMRATAALLHSRDANLRMVAAQQLGQTKNPAAAAFLREATADPDEMVAVAAIAAIEEAKGSAHIDILQERLSDPRWRVRAAAAKALGDMRAHSAGAALIRALGDDDHFVIREVLTALGRLNTNPSNEQLAAVAARVPDLAPSVVVPMVQALDRQRNARQQESLLAIYRAAPDSAKIGIWHAIADMSGRISHHDHYQQLYALAIDHDNSRLREAAARALQRMPQPLTDPLLSTLLRDDDPAVRRSAAVVVLLRASQAPSPLTDKQEMASDEPTAATAASPEPSKGMVAVDNEQLRGLLESGALDELPADIRAELLRQVGLEPTPNSAASDEAVAQLGEVNLTPGLAYWHQILIEQDGESGDRLMDLAIFASDPQPQRSLAAIRRAFAAEHLEEHWPGVELPTVAMILAKRLPPGGDDIIDRVLDEQRLYAAVLAQVPVIAHAPYAERIVDPQRIIALLDLEQQRERSREVVNLLLNSTNASAITIGGIHQASAPLREALASSNNSLAQAVHAFAQLATGPATENPFLDHAQAHSNPWVRFQAVQALVRGQSQGQQENQRLHDMLNDPAPHVASYAAWALLDQRLQEVVASPWNSNRFYYRDLTVFIPRLQRATSSGTAIAPPFTPDPPLPAAVAALMERVESTPLTSDSARDPHWPRLRRAAALLAAQHGDSRFIEGEWENYVAEVDYDADLLLAALMITRDARYLPILESRINANTSERELRTYLGYLIGMRGPEGRALRRTINDLLTQQRR